MKKKVLLYGRALIFIILPLFSLAAQEAVEAEGGEAPLGDSSRWALSVLENLKGEALAARIESYGEFSPERVRQEPRRAWELAVLLIHQHMEEGGRRPLYRAIKILDHGEDAWQERPSWRLYRGLAAAFEARIKKAFGMGALRRMRDELTAIAADHPDWYIRFMRGRTLLAISRGLPRRFFGDLIAEAQSLGKADLAAVTAWDASYPGTLPASMKKELKEGNLTD